MLVWIICLTQCLLPCYFSLVCWKNVSIWSSYSNLSHLITWLKLSKRINCCASIKYSFFLFFCTFFEKYFSKNIFFFLMRIIVLYIIIMRLIKNTIWIVIAIWIFISNSSCLTNLRALIHSNTLRTRRSILAHHSISTSPISIWSLACNQEYSFMKATNNWDFRLLLLLYLLLSILCLLSWVISCRLWLLCRLLWIQLRILVICASLSLLLLRTLIIFRR